MTKFFAALIPATLALVAAPVSAQSGSWPIGDRQMRIYYVDLDMNSAPGRAALLARVERAARKLCREVRVLDRKRCADDTVQSAAAASRGQVLATALGERDAVSFAAR